MTGQPLRSPRLIDAALSVSWFIERKLIVARKSFEGEPITGPLHKAAKASLKELVEASEEIFQGSTESEGGHHD